MGIKDLLRFMKPYVEPIHIKKYAGKRVGIDAYSWLHKGAYSCSMELCLNMEGDKKYQYINYCMHRINMLRHHNISPVLVFDGANIPCKALEEQHRHSKRKDSRDLAITKLKEGNVNAATEMFQRAVSITPSMAHQLIQILRSENIEFIVAPYEADAQLAYLSSLDESKGGISAVISEDSDLLAYGCSSVIFKMDRYGNGEEIVIDQVFDAVGCRPSFRHFNKELFTGMCIIAGCDFLPSVPGIGIAKAHALVTKYLNLDRALSVLKYEKGNQMPEDYFKSFKEAFAVFLHARIYDVASKRLKHLTPLPETLLHSLGDELDFLGPDMPSSQATAIAKGQLDPSTMKAFDELPSSNGQRKSTAVNKPPESLSVQPKRKLKQQKTTESCFTFVTSQKPKNKRITVMEKETKPNFIDKYPELEKLISSVNDDMPSILDTIPPKRSSMVPDNNPFKRRKQTQVEDLEVICNSQPTNAINEVETKSSSEQRSGVTDLDKFTPDSQKSVESKPIKNIRNQKSGKKAESISAKKKNSILNYFSWK
ncbi:exonuclease 1 [Rutidosis leptorrhynchoides]|uniref:exonuclease 1 n=1 Tax=Rutidosis leptorrhynchoides TaxID=125765 RepID=UPI003A9A33F5